NAAVTRRPSLHRRKQAPASLIKACKQGLVACANRILVDHPVTIHSPQTTGNPLHFAADAPRFINSWASPKGAVQPAAVSRSAQRPARSSPQRRLSDLRKFRTPTFIWPCRRRDKHTSE